MKITILTAGTNLESLARVRLINNLLKENYQTEIIAVVNKKSDKKHFTAEFPDLQTVDFNLGSIYKDLLKKVKGDLIYAIRANPASFGLAMSFKNQKKIPVILDIDSLEVYRYFPYSRNLLLNFLFSLWQINNPNSFLYTWMVEKRIKRADWITSSSGFFRKKYGGSLLPNVCNPDFFDPGRYKRDEIRRTMNWENSQVILTIFPDFKSIDLDLLFNAYNNLAGKTKKLVIISKEDPKLSKLIPPDSDITLLDWQPLENLAKLISAADLFVLPLKDIPYNQGIVPAAIFKAMSGKLPVIATDWADTAEVIADCGITIPPGDLKALSESILKILNDPEYAGQLARHAREKCLEEYNEKKYILKIKDIIEKKIKL